MIFLNLKNDCLSGHTINFKNMVDHPHRSDKNHFSKISRFYADARSKLCYLKCNKI